MQVEKTVFISYRRDNVYIAKLVRDKLDARGYDVFFDFESIGSGDFEQFILSQIASRGHFIVILTPSALERCNEPNDWLRKEIEYALDNQRNIIPLMFDNFKFTDFQEYLTGKLALLPRYNGRNIYPDYVDKAIDILCSERFLDKPLDVVLHPLDAHNSVQRWQHIQVDKDEALPTSEKIMAEAYFERGNSYFYKDKNDEAIHWFKEAIRLNPDFTMAYNNCGNAYAHKNDFANAIVYHNRAIELSPKTAQFYANRGNVYMGLEQWKEAVLDYNISIDLDSSLSVVYSNRAISYAQQGNKIKALEDYTNAIKLDSDNPVSYVNRCHLRLEDGDYVGCAKDADQAIALNRYFAEPYMFRAEARFLLGDFRGALSDFREANELKPYKPSNIAGVSITLHLLDDEVKALTIWQRMIERNVEYSDADHAGALFEWKPPLIEELRKLIAKL